VARAKPHLPRPPAISVLARQPHLGGASAGCAPSLLPPKRKDLKHLPSSGFPISSGKKIIEKNQENRKNTKIFVFQRRHFRNPQIPKALLRQVFSES